jgi:hypothetical protein
MIRQVSGVATRPAPLGIDFRQLLAWASTRRGMWTVWGITRAIMLVNLIIGRHYCDPQFYQYAGDFAVGKLPYISVPVEYPPLGLLLILLPTLPLLPFGGIAPRPEAVADPMKPDPIRYGAYGISFGIFMLALDALTLLLVMRVARRWTANDATGRMSGLIYILLGMASGAILQKFDLAVGTLCLLAIVMLVERRAGWAWAFLALATLAKGYPVLLAPLFVVWMIYAKEWNRQTIQRALVGGGIAGMVFVVPIMLASGIDPLLHSIMYHADRGIEIESTWASLMLLVGWVGGLGLSTGLSGSDLSLDIHSALETPLSLLALPALIALTLIAYFQFWRRLRVTQARFGAKLNGDEHSRQMLFTYLLHGVIAVTLIFLVTFRAFPAHYLLAVLPLVAVLRLPGQYDARWLSLLVAGMILGQLAVSFWVQIVALDPGSSLLLIARNVLLVGSLVVLLRTPLLDLWKAPKKLHSG